MKNFLKSLYYFITDYSLFRFINNRKSNKKAPFPTSLYMRFINDLKNRETIVFPAFNSTRKEDQSKSRFFFRHDIDTQKCVNNLDLFSKMDKQLKLPSSFYFRVDNIDYSFEHCEDQIKKLHADGFEVGLHTSCYTYEDPTSRFIEETDYFQRITGIKPKSFTLHGLGNVKLSERKTFKKYIANNLTKYGYVFTDCSRKIRKYNYVVEDCHVDGDGDRFIYNDLEESSYLKKNGTYLFLTHPCYWENDL